MTRHLNVSINYDHIYFAELIIVPIKLQPTHQNTKRLGSGCGAVGRIVTFDTRDLHFESSPQQILFSISCNEKTKIKKKRPVTSKIKKT